MRIFSAQFLMNMAKAIWSVLEYPLTIIGKSKRNLDDYTIYGNTVDGNSVGDLVTEGEQAGKYKVPVTVRGKNLLNMDGMLNAFLKKNADGSYTQEITSGGTRFSARTNINLKAGQIYTITLGSYDNSSSSVAVIRLQFYGTNGTTLGTGAIVNDYNINLNGGIRFTPTADVAKCAAYMSNGTTGSVTISNIQILEGDRLGIVDEYEPYIEPVTTDIYLDSPLTKGQSISYKGDSLPSLPQFKGTTVYEVKTSIPPSGIQVKYY